MLESEVIKVPPEPAVESDEPLVEEEFVNKVPSEQVPITFFKKEKISDQMKKIAELGAAAKVG